MVSPVICLEDYTPCAWRRILVSLRVMWMLVSLHAAFYRYLSAAAEVFPWPAGSPLALLCIIWEFLNLLNGLWHCWFVVAVQYFCPHPHHWWMKINSFCSFLTDWPVRHHMNLSQCFLEVLFCFKVLLLQRHPSSCPGTLFAQHSISYPLSIFLCAFESNMEPTQAKQFNFKSQCFPP